MWKFKNRSSRADGYAQNAELFTLTYGALVVQLIKVGPARMIWIFASGLIAAVRGSRYESHLFLKVSGVGRRKATWGRDVEYVEQLADTVCIQDYEDYGEVNKQLDKM